MERKQFPIRPCFAITGNKSQGQTFEEIGIYLENDFFTHGQLYVAFSRVGKKSAVKIFRPKNHPFPDTIRNVVYKEVLTAMVDEGQSDQYARGTW